MQKRTKLIVGGLAAAAVVVVGGGVGIAAVGDDDQPLRGSAHDRATTAAIEHLGEGTVTETEAGDDGASYGVEVRLESGRQVEVSLDESFDVIGSETDEDEASESDGGGGDD